jgi:septal ring factor EnvC (AmiA/AmiB activator)
LFLTSDKLHVRFISLAIVLVHLTNILLSLAVGHLLADVWALAMSAVLQAVQKLQAAAAALEGKLSQSGCELAQLQEQSAQHIEEAAAGKAELLRRCEGLEAELREAHALLEAAAAELKQSKAQDAEVYIIPCM